MKKLFLILTLSIMLLSCKKKYCWLCEQDQSDGSVIIETLCDKTESEINTYENENNSNCQKR
jgi:hypothetical protein